MAYMAQRHNVIAQNIAHADTPKYKARDLKPVSFKENLNRSSSKLKMASTSPMHLNGSVVSQPDHRVMKVETSETKPNGNNVVLTEETIKQARNSSEYQKAAKLYKKMSELLKIVVKT